MPPIANLLLREADAWRAVLGLHSTTVSTAHQLAQEHTSETLAYEGERATNSESREAAYCSALTGLASQCDALVSEVLKLRTLRKARRCVEVKCVKEIVRSHSDELLAIGQTLASNGALNVATATAEIRAATQKQRNQLQQLRMLLEAVCGASTLPLPKDGKLVVGIAVGDTPPETCGLDSLMSSAFNDARELNESSLATALSKLFSNASRLEGTAAPRQFARRAGERTGAVATAATSAVTQ